MRQAIIPNIKIAVIDSEQLTREFIANVMMYSVNRNVLSFENAEDLKDLIRRGEKIDLVLADIHLPGLGGGLELLRFVKEQSPNTLFIAMSANPADEDAAVDMSADAFLAKPFALQDLFNIVQRFVVEGKA